MSIFFGLKTAVIVFMHFHDTKTEVRLLLKMVSFVSFDRATTRFCDEPARKDNGGEERHLYDKHVVAKPFGIFIGEK